MIAQLSLPLDTPPLKPQTRAVGSYRASARVMELRQAGYLIRTERKPGQTAVYWLEGRT